MVSSACGAAGDRTSFPGWAGTPILLASNKRCVPAGNTAYARAAHAPGPAADGRGRAETRGDSWRGWRRAGGNPMPGDPRGRARRRPARRRRAALARVAAADAVRPAVPVADARGALRAERDV